MDRSWFDPDQDILELLDTDLSPRARRLAALILEASAGDLADNPVVFRAPVARFDAALGAVWRGYRRQPVGRSPRVTLITGKRKGRPQGSAERPWRDDDDLIAEVMQLCVLRHYTSGDVVRSERRLFLRQLDVPVTGDGDVTWRFGPGVAPALAANAELRARLQGA